MGKSKTFYVDEETERAVAEVAAALQRSPSWALRFLVILGLKAWRAGWTS